MPGRFLQAEPLAQLIEHGAAHVRGRGADDLGRPPALRRASTSIDLSSFRMVVCGGSAVPRSLMEAFQDRLRRAHHPGLGHDRDEPARRGRRTRRGASSSARPRRWTGGRAPGASIGGVELRIVDDDGRAAAVGRRGGRRDRGAGPVDHRLVLRRSRRPRSSTTAGCAPATSARVDAQRVHPDHRPRQGRHQVGRRVDLVGRAREPAHGAPRRRRGGASSACPTRSGASGRWRASCATTGRPCRRGRAARVPRRPARARGSCPSGGRSSTRCRRPASASSTRRCCGPAHAAGELEVEELG